MTRALAEQVRCDRITALKFERQNEKIASLSKSELSELYCRTPELYLEEEMSFRPAAMTA
jgi:hypothetical protein